MPEEQDTYDQIQAYPQDEPTNTFLRHIAMELCRLNNLLGLPLENLLNGDIRIGVGGDIEISERR